jgi:protein-S-isoprenylcysteine O-methyltransferase Ste14
MIVVKLLGGVIRWVWRILVPLILPVAVLLVIPHYGSTTHLGQAILAEANLVVGRAVLALGALLFTWAFLSLLARGQSLGPWVRTTDVVAIGSYKFARHLMILGVCLMALGESMLFNHQLTVWFLAFSVGQIFYIHYHEEHKLLHPKPEKVGRHETEKQRVRRQQRDRDNEYLARVYADYIANTPAVMPWGVLNGIGVTVAYYASFLVPRRWLSSRTTNRTYAPPK